MNSDVVELIERWPLIKEFKLPEHSNVIVVGAYKGLAVEAIDQLYHPSQIVGYEPQMWAANEASARLDSRSNCTIIPFALWAGMAPVGNIPMGEWHTDACSFINTGPDSRQQGSGLAMDADLALSTLGFDQHIDLMVMNIEGFEYLLLPYLRLKGWLQKIDRLAVQWHYGLGSDPKDDNDVVEEMYKLVNYDSFILRHDERPAWTYFVKDLG